LNKVRFWATWLIATVLLVISGCESTPPGLSDSHWLLESYGNGQAPSQVLAGTSITLNFGLEAKTVVGTAGCNSYGSECSVSGQSIQFSNFYQTEVECNRPTGLMDQERQYLALLTQSVSFTISGNNLTIDCTGDRVLNFRIIPE
jgi:heat shock protein HslJ